MKTAAIIVAGGRSLRMGREKAFETIRGRTILSLIIARLQGQVMEIVINANGAANGYAATGLRVIPDLRTDVSTPLAGLHAALHFACNSGLDAVLTVPSDSPFLPSDLMQRLAGARCAGAVAASAGQAHYVTGLWSCELLPDLEHALASPRLPRLQDWAAQCAAAVVEWDSVPYDPFFNVNTPEDLADAERIAAEFDL